MEDTVFVRSELLFPAHSFNPTRVTICGLGAGGSHLAVSLGKLGVSNMCGCDLQTVETANVGPSAYGLAHIDLKKTNACASLVLAQTGQTMTTRDCPASELGELSGVVFICVDDMDVRKDILFDQCVPKDPKDSNAQKVHRVIEGRMSAETLTVHSIDPGNPEHVHEWLRYWFPQSEALPALRGCGAQSVSADYMAGIVARMMVGTFVEWFAWKQGRISRCHNQVRYDLSLFEGTGFYW